MTEYTPAEHAIADLYSRKFWNQQLALIGSVTRNELLELARKSREIIEQENRTKQTSS